jgi:hypothetical protein
MREDTRTHTRAHGTGKERTKKRIERGLNYIVAMNTQKKGKKKKKQ